ncbi:hypothetical protein I6I18_01540 [Kytococcus sedentarius]|uniref:Uncharacterized protein n=1 Tax=Kytococcus sedentarius (strain ATCC 14392 / DSM 20547 / JCM 11482 / CCUG 33030 / NBRC 15357 / NCTC 11040 / CCM 314 / 541) TaxID=478801 RepID=C7NEY3_KYTSD|nr:hypothetical protein [Kytococcus sedentarius]ACV05807.1 hypothetical protein Ksed_07510 [Kytococcus sedentarius DSM 20547]QQB64213.1 hypothetical protein I6I18_01540 [Kytococcus sedentarius]STX12779.1 Uncharacterised protein [Kytococcus sedentarius]
MSPAPGAVGPEGDDGADEGACDDDGVDEGPGVADADDEDAPDEGADDGVPDSVDGGCVLEGPLDDAEVDGSGAPGGSGVPAPPLHPATRPAHSTIATTLLCRLTPAPR